MYYNHYGMYKMTLMGGNRKVYRENYINLYGELKNQY